MINRNVITYDYKIDNYIISRIASHASRFLLIAIFFFHWILKLLLKKLLRHWDLLLEIKEILKT